MGRINKKVLAQIRTELGPAIEKVPRPPSYQQGLMVSFFVVLMMVFLYSMMLVLSFWLALTFGGYLFSGSTGIGQFMGARSSIFVLVIYAICFSAALSVFIALIRPLLAKRGQPWEPFMLHPRQEPVFFDFVNRICQSVGASPPEQIVVITQANAFAGFIVGPFDGRMQLAIGLPLIESLDTRMLAGVIAHEFGHFSQRQGMSLYYIAKSIDGWFVDSVHNEGVWDQKVYELSQSNNVVLSKFFMLVRMAVGCSQLLLMIIVRAAHFFMARFMREMEFDADRHSARLVGSRNFAKTARQINILSICESKTFEDLEHYNRTDQLPDNLFALLVDNEKHIDKKQLREVELELLKMETQWHDTHPCDRERIENVAQENADGQFSVECPASQLFSDYDALCHGVTLEF